MPSNSMYACVTCRVGGKGTYPNCLRDGHKVICFGSKITIPKKNNDRAWKRIERGELLWNRRKTRKRVLNDTVTIYETRRVEIKHEDDDCGHMCCNYFRPLYRVERVPGSEREITNFRRTPIVDLGG